MLPVKLAVNFEGERETMKIEKEIRREREEKEKEKVKKEKTISPPKPTACASVLQEWKEVTLKSGKKVSLLQEYKFCAAADTYTEAQKLAQAEAKDFLDKIEQGKAARERKAEWELRQLENPWNLGPKP